MDTVCSARLLIALLIYTMRRVLFSQLVFVKGAVRQSIATHLDGLQDLEMCRIGKFVANERSAAASCGSGKVAVEGKPV